MTTLTIGTGDNLHSCKTRRFSKVFAYVTTVPTHLCYRDIDELLVIGGVIWGNNLNGLLCHRARESDKEQTRE